MAIHRRMLQSSEHVGDVDWRTLGIVASVFLTMMAGSAVAVAFAFVLGEQSRQLDEDTVRLGALEQFEKEVIQRTSDTNVRETYTEKRLDRLEGRDGKRSD